MEENELAANYMLKMIPSIEFPELIGFLEKLYKPEDWKIRAPQALPMDHKEKIMNYSLTVKGKDAAIVSIYYDNKDRSISKSVGISGDFAKKWGIVPEDTKKQTSAVLAFNVVENQRTDTFKDFKHFP